MKTQQNAQQRRGRRMSYADRTRQNSRANLIIARSLTEQPTFHEDADGNMIREWKSSESSSYTNADLAQCLRNVAATDEAEMLGTVPPSAVKYCLTKGWLKRNPLGGPLLVTDKAAFDLGLPRKFQGRKIHFAAAPTSN